MDSDITLSGISYSGGKVSFTVTMPSTGPDYILDYYSIKNPGKGVYTKGGTFALELNVPAGSTDSGVKWYFDDAEVTGTSVTLSTAGSHTVEAEVSLAGGKKQMVTLEIEVK